MRRALSLIVATGIAIIVYAAPGQAGPQPTVSAEAWNATGTGTTTGAMAPPIGTGATGPLRLRSPCAP